MPQNPMIAEARKMHRRLRDAIRTGKSITVAMGDPSHSFRTIPLRERAKQAGVDDNDPLLVRALELQEKATDFRTNRYCGSTWKTRFWIFLKLISSLETRSLLSGNASRS
jgi:hypothetical protein